MHSAGIASIPPNDSADVDVAGSTLGMDDGADRQLSPLLGQGEEVQHPVDDHGFLAAKIPLRLVGSLYFAHPGRGLAIPIFGLAMV